MHNSSASFTGMTLILAGFSCSPAAGNEEPWSFKGPFGVAVNSHDVVYVSEINNARVSKFTADGEWIGVIREIGGYGKLVGPFDVAMGPDDWIYIADTRNHKVLALDADEKLQFVLGTGKKSMAPGSFGEPHFVAVNAKGELFVSDTFNARIQKFSRDGTWVKSWGRVGPEPGEYLLNGYLGGITCDNRGHVYVRETDGGRIQKYTEEGDYVTTFSQRGTGPGELDEGYGAVVVGDTFWAVDTFESRIQQFTLDGAFADMWDPGEGNSGAHFNHPVDLAATSRGEFIVTDWKNNRVLKLSKTGEFLETWGRGVAELLAYEPPTRRKRPPGHRVEFAIYGGLMERDLLACQRAGINKIYPSFDNQDGEWGIAAAVKRAHELGVKVHPSIAGVYFGQRSAFSQSHPEYHIWKKDAESPVTGLLSWAHPETRSFRAEHIVDQVRKTGVDGVMLDYIRYLGNDYGYDPIARKQYEARYGVDPATLPADDARWMQFRADYVTEFIVEFRRKLADLDRHVEVSVYGSGGSSDPGVAMRASLQDWRTWARMGIIDRMQVAHYTRDMDQVYTAISDMREAVPDRVRINCFLACYGGNLNTPEFLKKGIDVAIAAGADEITIYRIDAIWELDLWDAMKEAAETANSDR